MQGAYYPQIEQQIITQNIAVQEDGEIQHYPLSYYEMGKHLGRCSFGIFYEVRKYRGVSTENLGVPLIMKVIRNADSQLAKSIYQNEVRTLEFLKEKNTHSLVKNVRHWMHQGTFYIGFEKCKYGSLKTFIQYLKSKGETLNQLEILYVLREILVALQQLHKNGVIHGNLKPEHIIIGDNMNIKIMDYSLSQIAKYQQLIISNNCGTARYMAPQLFSQEGRTCSKKGDIWAIGIILYFLSHQKQPFSERRVAKFKKRLVKKEFQLEVPSQLNEILQKMVDKNPNNREQAEKLLQNQLFTKIIDLDSVRNELKKRLDVYMNEQSSKMQHWKRKVDFTPILHQQHINNIISRQDYEKVTILQLIHERQYGYFLLLSNFSVIAHFNNRKILKFVKQMLFSANSNEQKVIVRAYRTYFSSIIEKEISKGNQNQSSQMTCTIKKIIIVNGNAIITLSNNVFQIFFYQKHENNMVFSFIKSVCLNYNKINHSLLKFKDEKDIFYYQNFQKGLTSKHQRFFKYIQQVFHIISENSMITNLKTS